MTPEIKKPIFVVGLGRSGSSIFHRIFARYPGLAWLSPVADRKPHRPGRNRVVMRALDLPVLGRYLGKRLWPEEAYNFWETYCPGFRTPCRDLTAGDVTEKTRGKLPGALAQTTTDKRSRLLLKITGWPRLGYIKELFPDARFVHVSRDPRAVLNSMLQVNWWWGWRGPSNWRWGELKETHREIWERHNRSFVALAALQCVIFRDALSAGIEEVGTDDLMDIEYENFCAEPVETFRKVVEFCELPWHANFERVIEGYSLRNTNYKWRQDLTADQQRIVEDVLSSASKAS